MTDTPTLMPGDAIHPSPAGCMQIRLDMKPSFDHGRQQMVYLLHVRGKGVQHLWGPSKPPAFYLQPRNRPEPRLLPHLGNSQWRGAGGGGGVVPSFWTYRFSKIVLAPQQPEPDHW